MPTNYKNPGLPLHFYDSDEDLPKDVQDQLRYAYGKDAQKIRDNAWEKAGRWARLKRNFKGIIKRPIREE